VTSVDQRCHARGASDVTFVRQRCHAAATRVIAKLNETKGLSRKRQRCNTLPARHRNELILKQFLPMRVLRNLEYAAELSRFMTKLNGGTERLYRGVAALPVWSAHRHAQCAWHVRPRRQNQQTDSGGLHVGIGIDREHTLE